VGLVAKHQQLARQVGAFGEDQLANSMANSDDSNTVPAGTTLVFDSWVCIANDSGGFTSHLADPREPEASATPQRNNVDDFIDQFDEIPLPIHVKNPIRRKSPSELEEDLDQLLANMKQEATASREAPAFNANLDLIENNLKELNSIPRQKADNSDLINGIDCVSCSLADCIDLAESSLHKKMVRLEPERSSP